jgi:hypothetical protein
MDFISAPGCGRMRRPAMKSEQTPSSTPPTPQQLNELNDALVSATELEQIYAALAHHPRVQATPGSAEVFESCRQQLNQDIAVLDEHLESLRVLGRSAPLATEGESEGPAASPRLASFPDVEPADPDKSVFETVRRAFHVEDFLRQQLEFSLASAQASGHRKLELELKMIVLSVAQRCRLLDERYGFARSNSAFVQGIRKQTTRFLSRLQGEERRDID